MACRWSGRTPCWSTQWPRNSTAAAAANTRVDLQAVLLKDGEDLLEVLVVLLQCVAGDDEVVQVAEHEGQAFE